MEIAEVTGKEHKNIIRDIRDEVEKLENAGITTELKFELSERQDSTGRTIPYYILTKEGVLQLAARYDAVIRAKLIDLAMKQDKPLQIDSKMMFQIAQALENKEKQVVSLSAKIEQDKPKVLFANSVCGSTTSILIRDLAKLLKQNGVDVGEKRLFESLRTRGFLITKLGKDYNSPTQKSMDMQLMEVKETSINHAGGSITVQKTSLITGKGQQYFINKFLIQKGA